MTSARMLALSFSVALWGLSACSERHASAPTSPALVAEQTPEQKFAATLKQAGTGDAEAQSSLGLMYFDGDGVPKDTAKALEWYLKAAEQGHVEAQFKLGWMYGYGDGVPTDAAKAVDWWQKAAAQGDAKSQVGLGMMFHYGMGMPKDAAKAVEWYQKAAAQGHAQAQFSLGWMYDSGDGVPKDAAKAVEWYQKAAAQGHANAQVNLGKTFQLGDGIPKDATKAVEWYQKAATQGDAEAQVNLGGMYWFGDGVPKDAAKAVEWYQKAAVQGHANAQARLGAMYALGMGVPADKLLAYAWSNLAAAKGDSAGNKLRDSLEQGLSPRDLQEAARLSSNWERGQLIVRESHSREGSVASTGALAKRGTGTVFVVGKDGHAVTNAHVVESCTELRMEGREGVARVVTTDVVNDLALLKIPGDINATAALHSTPGKLRQGEDILVYGFPLNAVLSSGGNLTPGMVSALTGLGNNTNQIQITAPIQPGSSGSPVLNNKAEVVGVVSMKLSDAKMVKATGTVGQNVNFAVSGLTLKTFLEAHKVSYRTSGVLSFEKSAADLAEEARKWTFVVECWK